MSTRLVSFVLTVTRETNDSGRNLIVCQLSRFGDSDLRIMDGGRFAFKDEAHLFLHKQPNNIIQIVVHKHIDDSGAKQ